MLVLFHTAPANEETFSKMLAEIAPEIPVRHVVRKDLLDCALAEGGVSEALRSKTVAAMRDAAATADVALCTCSTIGECADEAGLLRVDRPMARLAAKIGSRVLVAACLETTVGPTVRLVEGQGAKHVRTLLIADAWRHWVEGDKGAYWQRIAEAIREELGDAQCVVLAQASMAGAIEHLEAFPVPILTSPESGLQAAVEAWRNHRAV